MAVGMCRHCGYSPVADDAPLCPKCGGRNPHPDATTGLLQVLVMFLLGAGLVAGATAALVYFLTHKG
jgi:hypothetical protein